MEKIIKGYPDYRINNSGKVISNRRLKTIELKPRYQKDGYGLIALYDKNGKRKDLLIHRIVAIHFILNPENLSEINHKDGNKKNNNANNLQWSTRSYNMVHAFKNKLKIPSIGIKNGSAKLNDTQIIEIRNLRKCGYELSYIADKYLVSITTIWRIVHKYNWKHIN